MYGLGEYLALGFVRGIRGDDVLVFLRRIADFLVVYRIVIAKVDNILSKL